MALPVLRHFGGYKGVNEGVHRKAADKVGHPAITRHIGFWEEPSTDPSNIPGGSPGKIRSEEQRINEVNEYISALKEHIDSAPNCHSLKVVPDTNVEVRDRGQIVIFTFRWCGLAATIRFEINTEFLTCTTLIDFSREPINRLVPLGSDSEARRPYVESLKALIESFNSCDGTDRTAYHADLYQRVWVKFENDILNFTPAFEGAVPLCGNRLGSVFADFRGLLLGDAFPLATNGTAKPSLPYPIELPFPGRGDNRGRPHEYECQTEDWARAVTLRAEQFMLIGLEHAELTVSRFLDGRILYISALGPQGATGATPVYYSIHSCTDDEWQIGRLVDRLHNLGSLRLAASIQINDLSLAAAKLKIIETKIETIRESIRRFLIKTDELEEIFGNRREDRQGAGFRKRVDDKRIELKREKENISKEYSALSFAINEMNGAFLGSIEDRIQQGKYYIEKFKTDSQSLRQLRLEGYQPYIDFVLRRLGGTFSFISLMSERVASFQTNLALLHDSYIGLDLSVTNKSIEALQRNVAHQDTLMENIQDVGEIVLFCVVAPHYLNETVFRLLAGADDAPRGALSLVNQILGIGASPNEFAHALLLLAAILIGCAIAASRIMNAPHTKDMSYYYKLIGIASISALAVIGFLIHFPYGI